MLNRWIRRVAAIDEGLMRDVPKYDKIWATHIGYMLILTFVILFGIVYMSIGYFGASQVLFDATTNTLSLHSNQKTTTDTIISIVIALVIAGMIFMFDRAIYQSDWFAQAPYKIEMSRGERIAIFLGKLWRVVVRLSISAALAFALSTFVELYIYESQLLDSMQKNHLKENKNIYESIKQFSIDQKSEIEKTTKSIIELEYALEEYQNGRVPHETTGEEQKRLTQNITSLQNSLNSNQKSINQTMQQALIPLEKKLKRLVAKKTKEQEVYNKKEIQMMGEDAGIKNDKISGILINGTGRTGCGVVCKIHKKAMEQSKEKLALIQKEIDIAQSNIFLLKSKYHKMSLDREDSYMAKKIEINRAYKEQQTYKKAQQLKNVQKNQEKLKEKLEEQKAHLYNLQNNQKALLSEYTQRITSSPAFIRFRDGPVTRLMALDDLYGDSNHGEKMYEFSILIKIFLMFLEVLPVLVKVLFSPPSVYAVMLQQQAAQGVKRAYDGDTDTLEEIERQIGLEERRRELNELRNKRLFEESISQEYKNNTSRYKKSA
ncbi:MAG: hypothetical protein DRG30_06485 [Epsilonproteobacteria bacterium]|nr:MAG: hypothetical protein DRG30_06485 [Campylobacterota bacterium]